MCKVFQTLISSNPTRFLLVGIAQAFVFTLSGVAAFALRFDFNISSNTRYLVCALPIWLVVKTLAFYGAHLNVRGFRYVSLRDLSPLIFANLAGSAVSCICILAISPAGFPRSIYVGDFLLCLLCSAGFRVAIRMVAESARAGSNGVPERRTLIYGAGDAGITLLREIRNNPKLAYHVCGFIDDGSNKRGVLINGAPVLGSGPALAALVRKHKIEVVLIAIPSALGAEMAHILALCHEAGVKCKTIPGLEELIEGVGFAHQIRDVAVEDLLGRTPVRLDDTRIRGSIRGKMVMVTGAAGSIGAELCRQIARFHPAGIVGFEIAESPLFEIDQEMRKTFPNVPFYPEVGSIQNRARLEDVLGKYQPQIIYHAAAYKHVPLMETHAFEAIENNVFGTYNVASLAGEYGVQDFVMISSDKAVRPTNVMGATKRVAELLLLALQYGRTQYIAVRFGNVLGSNGSVIPTFKKQIAAGGPVTVTHPEMRRFFMTIPEACQLVLQAGTIGKGRQICVLDMGQSVKIIDLARSLILLSGLKPNEDIQIKFTGMRPGEKLYEELSTLLESTTPSDHEKIRIFVGNGVPDIDLILWLESLREICASRDLGRLTLALKEVILDYSPSVDLLRRIVDSHEEHAVLVG